MGISVVNSIATWGRGKMRGSFVAIFCGLLSFNLLGANCPKEQSIVDGNWKTIFECENGQLIISKEIYLKSNSVTNVKKYDSLGRITSNDSWNVEGKHTFSQRLEWLDNNQFLVQTFFTSSESKGKLKSKELRSGILDKSILLKEWVISKKSFKVHAIRHFKNGYEKPWKIDVIDKWGELIKYYVVKYNPLNLNANLVSEFDCFDPQGNLIGHYNEAAPFDVVSHISQLNLDKEEIQRRINIFNDKNREAVVVIDTGFDIMHPALTHKLYNSSHDIPADGIDNDGNGRIDDSWGWQRQDDPGLGLQRDDNNIRETHSLIHTPYPVSHGTHVAALALKDLDSYGLVGFAGDVAIPDHLSKANEFIREKAIKFVNMSFSIGYPGAPMSAPRDSFYELENLIKENPETLFVVAAGNGRNSLDLDELGNDSYPASYMFENALKVGAINTSELNREDFEKYKVASFSKYGKTKVQIFAPGQGVESAQSGGGAVALSGTSMAAPYVLNVLLKGHQINPKLSPMELKQLLMETAYIPLSGRLPCESGGFVWPEKFYQAIRNR